jgi:glucose uptake protein GlcU
MTAHDAVGYAMAFFTASGGVLVLTIAGIILFRR